MRGLGQVLKPEVKIMRQTEHPLQSIEQAKRLSPRQDSIQKGLREGLKVDYCPLPTCKIE